MGATAGCCGTSARHNIMFGAYSGRFMQTGCCNISMGRIAGCDITTGCNNIFIGECAGCLITGGCENIVIGPNNNVSGANVNNQVHIDSGVNIASFCGSETAWTFVSDSRDKQNISDLNIGKDFLGQLRPRNFEWNFRHTAVGAGQTAAGFIAQEVKEVVDANPGSEYLGVVKTDDPELYKVASGALVPVLVKAVQELSQENAALAAMIMQLQNRVTALEG
jgi:hypothetical protein